KGGTCLIKSYLGYYRFSEDIDFTWKNQNVFKEMSQKQIRRYLSEVIGQIGETLEKTGMDFISDKGNKNYVELTGGNKTATFKLWYDSETLKYRTFVKIQINFVEKLLFPSTRRKMHSLLYKKELQNIEDVFPDEYKEYSKDILFSAYDIREILCEKIRAILTRRGSKARDFVDIHMICTEYDLEIQDLESQIIDKTRFILKMYRRYRENIMEKMRLIEKEDLFEWGNEKNLLLQEIDENSFYEFMDRLNENLTVISKSVLGRMN
ncbi:MAG TPA: nucleotidyl transferase AbiEii/AbiGii toxin family protein, partial [Thermoplasmatales archaeon]|nr:nucleotidyl transferase AbiEii/AbiGii toxin family protein [Thermoplasmatales archaeon]